FPRVSKDDWLAVELIRDAGLKAEVWGFSRAVDADVKALVELGVRASVIESPISDLKLEALGVDREAMLERIVYAISFAVEQGITVAFFGVDGTRADLGYFETVYKTAVEAGAQEVVVVDTLGIATPEAVADLVGRTREWLGADRAIHFHGHNDFGLATAAAVAAARAGANWIQGTVNGMGERAGNANLPEIALALRGLYGIETNLRLEHVRSFSEKLRELSGYELEPYKPLVGENLFRRESGAVASQFHDPPAIEPYSSDLVGTERGIVLGKKSGIDSIRIKAQELGLELDVFSAWHPLWVGGAAHAELGEELAMRGLAYLNTELPTATAFPDGTSAFLTTSAEANAAALGEAWRESMAGVGAQAELIFG